jgi:hypothetical protein
MRAPGPCPPVHLSGFCACKSSYHGITLVHEQTTVVPCTCARWCVVPTEAEKELGREHAASSERLYAKERGSCGKRLEETGTDWETGRDRRRLEETGNASQSSRAFKAEGASKRIGEQQVTALTGQVCCIHGVCLEAPKRFRRHK